MDLIVLGSVAFLTVVFIILYNNLIKRKNEVSNAFSSVDVMLKKRYDLIPNLVEVTKRYMDHEKGVLTEITRLRTLVQDISSEDKLIENHNAIQRKMNELLVSIENYPTLKADSSFLSLQANWTSTEEQISAARRYYNTAVTEYNNYIQMFPSNIVANVISFKEKKVFEVDAVERKNVKASELF